MSKSDSKNDPRTRTIDKKLDQQIEPKEMPVPDSTDGKAGRQQISTEREMKNEQRHSA